MDGFDAELYLRLLGERALLSGESGRPFASPLVERARALVAVGAIDADAAQKVVDDYARAARLRGSGHGVRHRPQRHSPAVPRSQRIAFCNRTIEQPWGRLELLHATLSDAETRLAVRLVAAPGSPPGRAPHHHGPLHNALPGGLTVTDDRGTTVSTGFSGGGTDEEWSGHYASRQPLAVDTAWLEVLGERVELIAPPDGNVEIQSLADLDPAQRYLQHCLEGSPHRHHRSGAVLEVLQAFVDCGALAPDAPLAAETHQVSEALAQISPHVTVPARWRPLFARAGAQGGPVGTTPVGAITPPFDDITAAVSQLASTEEGFRITLDLTGRLGMGGPFDDEVDHVWLTYSAVDDRDNAYLGELDGWSGGDDGLSGEVAFWPALDPRATRLELRLTANRSRAVIRFPLDWSPA